MNRMSQIWLMCLAAVFPALSVAEIYVGAEKENLRATPKGAVVGELVRGTRMQVIEEKGSWVKVSVEGWIWKESTATVKPEAHGSTAEPLELVSFNKVYLAKDIKNGQFSDKVYLSVKVKNNTNARISGWRGVLILSNGFGDTVFRGRLTDGTANIKPGGVAEAGFSWEDNQFIKDEPFDKLMAYSVENLAAEFTDVKLIQ